MIGERPAVVLDTNIFVAALFNPRSDAARILDAVRHGKLQMVWNEATRRETRRILEQIPPLAWNDVEELFRTDHRYEGKTAPSRFSQVPDPEDRKFAALAHAAGALLVSRDEHLLAEPQRMDILVLTPQETVAEGWIDR
mgnify:CR=1 FL=1